MTAGIRMFVSTHGNQSYADVLSKLCALSLYVTSVDCVSVYLAPILRSRFQVASTIRRLTVAQSTQANVTVQLRNAAAPVPAIIIPLQPQVSHLPHRKATLITHWIL